MNTNFFSRFRPTIKFKGVKSIRIMVSRKKQWLIRGIDKNCCYGAGAANGLHLQGSLQQLSQDACHPPTGKFFMLSILQGLSAYCTFAKS